MNLAGFPQTACLDGRFGRGETEATGDVQSVFLLSSGRNMMFLKGP